MQNQLMASVEEPFHSESARRSRRSQFVSLGIDAVASVIFWYAIVLICGSTVSFLVSLFIFITATVVWRLRRTRMLVNTSGVVIPYTCGYCSVGGKELFIVATVHISPRAPKDVRTVIDTVRPDVVLIELDDERLDDMRADDVSDRTADMQSIEMTIGSEEPETVLTMRALWNGERSGDVVSSTVAFDEDNPYGLAAARPSAAGKIALVSRGGPSGQLANFSLKANNAARDGALAVLVVNSEPDLPLVTRIGRSNGIMDDLRVARRTRNFGFPPIPLLLLPHDAGERLRVACRDRGDVRVAFRIMQDDFPRRTVRRELCQSVALLFSGVIILYGIVECFTVDVGGEFLAAEITARTHGIPCACIDVDMNRLCSRIGRALLPTPCNVLQALLSWLALPRVLCKVFFPGTERVDVLGGAFLHTWSFHCKTWIAILVAGICAGGFVAFLLASGGKAAAGAATGAGVIPEKESADMQAYVMLGIEMYALPLIYDSVAASRDEAMYNGIVAKAAEQQARRIVAVVGAAHANGILHRARTRGLAVDGV